MNETLSVDPFDITRRRSLKLMTGLMSALLATALGIPLIGGIIGPSFRQKNPQLFFEWEMFKVGIPERVRV